MIDQSNRSGRCFETQPLLAACETVVQTACVCRLAGQGGPYSPEGAALGGYSLDGQAHLGLRTAGRKNNTRQNTEVAQFKF